MSEDMEKHQLESLIIDYIDNNLNAVDRRKLEQELRGNPELRKLHGELKEVMKAIESSPELIPSSSLKTDFEKALRREISRSEKTGIIFFQPFFYRAAAVVLLVLVSGAIGFWISQSQSDNERLANVEREMAIARQQLSETKGMMMTLLKNKQSASQRIKGVTVAMDLPTADEDIVRALFHVMNADPNTNVRMAALEALAGLRDDPVVRKGLIDALLQQRDPAVQIALIHLMVQMREEDVVDDLKRIVNDKGILQAVKDEAYSGILKLS